jgi:GNAT superfamily N-acetyltransferase
MSFEIRSLAPEDRAAWEPLWTRYLAYHGWPRSQVMDTTWARLMDASEPMHALGAFEAERLEGFAHYIFHRYTWTAGDYCLLADLLTTETARRQGIGRALVEAVFDRARAAGAFCVYGMTQADALSRALYDQVAEPLNQVVYRKVL